MGNFLLLIYYTIYLVAVFNVGRIFLEFVNFVSNNNFEKKIFEFAFGNVFYSLIFIYLGIFHLLYKEILLIFFVLPIFFFSVNLAKSISKNNLLIKFKKLLKAKFSLVDFFIFALLVLALSPIFPFLFSFPTSWDPLAYHLMLPKLHLENHSLAFYPWFTQSSFPIAIESLFGFGEIFGDPRISNFIVFSFIIAIAVYMVYGIRYLFSQKVLMLALFLLLFRKMLYSQVAMNPFVDYPFVFYGLIISVLFIKFIKLFKQNYLYLILFLGLFCILIKFTGIIFFLSIITSIFLYVLFSKRKNFFKIFLSNKKLNLIIILVLIPIGFLFLRNYIFTHNPVYPYLNDVFKGLNYEKESYEAMIADPKSHNLTPEIIQNFLLKIPEEYQLTKQIILESLFSAVIFIFSFFGLFYRNPIIRYSSFFGLLSGILMTSFVGFPAYRYSAMVLPILAITTSFIFFDLFKKHKWFEIPLIFLLTFSVVIQFFSTVGNLTDLVKNDLGRSLKSIISYSFAVEGLNLQDNWQAINYVNKNLNNKKDKILILFDNRLFYYKIPIVYDDPSITGLFTNPLTKSTEEIAQKMKEMKITYVVVNNNWGFPAKLRQNLYYEFVNNNLVLISSSSGTMVYKIKNLWEK